MKEIDLKEIYKKNLLEILYRGIPGPNPKSLPYDERGSMNIHMNSPSADAALVAMREVCIKILQLAAENAEINSIETSDDSSGFVHEVNKQSILNTINQVK